MNLPSAFRPSGFQAFLRRALGITPKDFLTGADIDGVNNSARLTHPYRQSAWIRAAINFISGEISSRPVKFYDDEQDFGDDAFTDWWASPAFGLDTLGKRARIPIADVLEQLTIWAKLKGEFFILLDDAWVLATASRNPAALSPFIIANPDRVRIIRQGPLLAGYEYIDPAGQRYTFVPEQVIHWHNHNPYDPYRGLGDLDAALTAAEAAHATGVYVRDLMRNNNDQGYIVVGKNGVASDEQRDQIVTALRAKRAALARGVARDIFLTGDITVDRPKEQAAGAGLLQGKALSHQEIFIAFGVPPSLAEVKASYSIGSASDRYALITGTCMPLGKRITSALAQVATLQAGTSLTAELDWDDHPTMVEVRAERVKTAQTLWAMGMPMSDINDYLSLGMQPYDGWATGYLPFNVAPVAMGDDTAPTDPAQNPAFSEPPATEDPAALALRMATLVRARKSSTGFQPVCRSTPPNPIDLQFACTCQTENCKLKTENSAKERDPRELAAWRTLMTARLETVAAYKSAFGRVLMQARRETLAKIETHSAKSGSVRGVHAAPTTKTAAADLLFDLETFRATFRSAMDKQTTTALQRAGQQLFKELALDDPFTSPPPAAIQFLKERQNKLANIPDAIHAQIKTTLEEGLNAGDTMQQLAARVRATCNDIDRERAQRIAMTETAAAYGTARNEAMQQAGVPYKQWLTSGNDNVRDAHIAANRQTVDADAPFHVDGEDLAYPGDSRGSPENVINCHCVAVAVATKESKN